MGLAIPAQIVRPTVEALIRDGKSQPWIYGHWHQRRDAGEFKVLRLERRRGALVTQVETDSPAEKPALKWEM